MPMWLNTETDEQIEMSFADAHELRAAGQNWVWMNPHDTRFQHRPAVEPPPMPTVADIKKRAKKIHDAQA